MISSGTSTSPPALWLTGSFLGALSARAPGDGDLEYQDRDQELAGSQIQEDPQPASLATRSSTEARTSAIQEPVAAPRPAEPAQGSSSLTGSLRQGPPAAPRGERVSGLSRHVPSCLGIARTVAVSGRGNLTLGELAMEGFRRAAKQLREEWESEDRYVKQSVGRIIVGGSVLPTASQVKHLERAARDRFTIRASARLRQADLLDQMAADVAAQLQAAGVELSSSGGAVSPQPGTSDEASGTGDDANAPGAGGASAAPEIAIQSYVRLGVAALRNEVTRIRELARNKDLGVEQHLAERMARSLDPNPSEKVVYLWRHEAKRSIRLQAKLGQKKAAALEAQAIEWESRLASGSLMQDDPDEGPSSGRRASKKTSETGASTGGRAGSRRQCRQTHLAGRRQSTFIPRDPPLKSASHIVHPGDTLRGTVLGSRVELPTMGEVPYAQLAIDKLRMEAAQLYDKWKDKDEYVQCRIAERMREGNNRSPRDEDVQKWIVSARHIYCRQARVRIQEAAVLQELADNLERRAEAEGVMVRSSQESPAHGSEPAGGLQAAESERVSGGSSHTPVPTKAEMTFAHLAIQNLRKEAQSIETVWLHDEAHFVAERVAYRMARANDPSPSPAVKLQWQYRDKSYFQSQCAAHLQRARDLRSQADALEVELESLLSSTSGRAPESSLETESTAPFSGKTTDTEASVSEHCRELRKTPATRRCCGYSDVTLADTSLRLSLAGASTTHQGGASRLRTRPCVAPISTAPPDSDSLRKSVRPFAINARLCDTEYRRSAATSGSGSAHHHNLTPCRIRE
ncbi:UNVERIFIED_CONTAM: KRUF family protein [Hammondia hammondi]|eukprot:XP_008888594.1 KRUF family protein [Hammondia hammondi]